MTKAYTEYLWFETKKRKELIRITDKVQEAVRKSGVKEGLCLISAMHLTASVFVQDDEEGLHEDIWQWLEKLAPFRADYRHHLTGEDNGDAHLKNLLTHLQVVLPITDGRLDLGPWQEVFYAEYDGQRPKRVVIKILGI
ncbi:secondary thiamine-phosphate synthase enzyme YjbQ [Persephonella sp.]